MAREKVCGIYRIENLINHKSYIGQSIDIYERWVEHKWALNNQQHNNTHLVRSWYKYGPDNFEFTIIERCNEIELNDREIYWVDYYDAYYNGYNQTKGGDGCLGKVWTEEEIEKISQSVFQIDLSGSIIRKWPSIEYASRQLNLNARQIWNCANKHITYCTRKNGKTYSKIVKTVGGYIWVYEKDIETFQLEDHIDTRNKPIRQYDLTWNLIKIWPSAEYTKNFGYSHNTVADTCKGKFMQANGYIWTYDDIELDQYIEWYKDHFDVKYIGQYTLSGELVKVWNTPVETEQDGFRAGSVREVLKGNQFVHRGYKFDYIPWRELKNINWKGQLNYGKYEEYN